MVKRRMRELGWNLACQYISRIESCRMVKRSTKKRARIEYTTYSDNISQRREICRKVKRRIGEPPWNIQYCNNISQEEKHAGRLREE
jgi:hypothetical protein